MAHKIEPEDLAMGTIERHESESVSWHALETVRNGLSVDNCGLREMAVEAAPCVVTFKGVEFPSSFNVPAVEHPIKTGELLFLGKPYDASYALFTPRDFVDFAGQCFAEAGLDKSIAFTTSIFAGRRMTIAKRIPESDFSDAHGHKVASYFNLLNSLDGTWPVFANVSEIRTVCYNTATANLMDGGASCKHRPDALGAFVKSFPAIFAEAIKAHEGSANDYLQLANIPMSKNDASYFFAALLTQGAKMSKRAHNQTQEDLMPLFVKGRGCYGASAADAYNAITEHYTHNGTVESNAPGGTGDNRKRAAKEALLSDGLRAMIERGKELVSECKA